MTVEVDQPLARAAGPYVPQPGSGLPAGSLDR